MCTDRSGAGIRDAALAGGQELARFLRQTQEEDRRRADRAKELLGQRLVPGRSPSPQGIGAAEIAP